VVVGELYYLRDPTLARSRGGRQDGMAAPVRMSDVNACVERIVAWAGSGLRVAAPLGLGKPNVLLNALYRRAIAEPGLTLHLCTALSLTRPAARSDLERRFLAPFLERHFGADYPDLEYAEARRAGRLPTNVRISEFYFQPGAMLGDAEAQREYISLNYTHAARDLAEMGINVITQLVARRDASGRERWSLACNPDVTQDLLDVMAANGRPRPLVVGVVHPELPFVGNEAEVNEAFFDLVLDDPACAHALFASPRERVEIAEFALGLQASSLVRDGGTLQIGIGAMSDALVYGLLLRHQRNADYRAALDALGGPHPVASRLGGLDPFARGLYGASEMVMDGFMHLARAGVLQRHVYDDAALEHALADGTITDTLDGEAAERLYARGALAPHIDRRELARLIRFGLLPAGTRLEQDALVLPDGSRLDTDLRHAPTRAALGRVFDGRRLRNGRYLRGAFFLGSKEFYAWLRGLDGAGFDGFSMTRVSDINELYGGPESLAALQRRGARFFNTCMMATALGAAVSDALEDGRVVSGVGGQYNFVAMAHALRDGRSVLLLRSNRVEATGARSNVTWSYGHTTIPRHLRDVFVTEYGVADLRGKSDQDCVMAMLAITDARFLDGLVARAKRAGKLRTQFSVPDRWRQNTPARLHDALRGFQARGLFTAFPFGSDFTAEERRLLPALQWLKRRSGGTAAKAVLLGRALAADRALPEDATALGRMGLAAPHTMGERLLRRVVALGLAATR
jgi:acyl-CoA hydrolase